MALPTEVTSLASAVATILAKEAPDNNSYLWMVKSGVEKAVKVGTAVSADLTTSPTDTTAGRALKVGAGGLLSQLDLRSTVFGSAATPADVYSKGYLSGFASGGPDGLGIPEIPGNNVYGILEIFGHWQDASGSNASATERFTVNETIFTRHQVNATTWGPWEKSYTSSNVAASAQNLLENGSYDWGQDITSEVLLSLTEIGANSLNRMITIEGTEFGFPATTRPTGVLYKGPLNTRWSFVGVTDNSELRAVIANSTGAKAELYHTGNILGTVSQSGGVPTGAIIERGSNANGEYVKFADGTLICWWLTSKSAATADTVESFVWGFPASFISAPKVVGGVQGPGATFDGLRNIAAYSSIQRQASRSNPNTAVTIYYSKENTITSYFYDLLAIGRWY